MPISIFKNGNRVLKRSWFRGLFGALRGKKLSLSEHGNGIHDSIFAFKTLNDQCALTDHLLNHHSKINKCLTNNHPGED